MSMMRVTHKLKDDLKMLKDSLGMSGSYGDIVHSLVKAELDKTHVVTGREYISVGAVVKEPSGKIVVISAVEGGNVVFSDNTYIINGGMVCKNLMVLAASVEEYDGGPLDV